MTLAIESPVAAVSTADPNARSKPGIFLGLTMGLLAAAIGALYLVYATYGLARGLKSKDITFVRTSVAGMLMLPVLVYYLCFNVKALTAQWRRWLAVAFLAGPLFGQLVYAAFQFAPPSHGAVFLPAAMSVVGTIFAAVFLADPLTQRKLLGISIVAVGLLTVSGVSSATLTGRASIGDFLFIAAGTLWAGFGVVMRKFRLDPVLGAARAAIFPALVPGLAALMGWPVLGHIPTLTEGIGLTLAIVGLLVTVTHRAEKS